MATITLFYDSRNKIAKRTIEYILSIGLFKEKKEEKKEGKTLLDEAIEDVRAGRVFEVKDLDLYFKKLN